MSAGPPHDEVFEALTHRSREVYRQFGDGELLGVRQQEETITETLLLELGRATRLVSASLKSRARESLEGADWEWWIRGRSYWFGMLVQAKRRRQSMAKPYDFGYVGGSGVPQVDLLRQEALRRNLAGVYVLYNGPDLLLPEGWMCGTLSPTPSLLGATFLAADAVAWLDALNAVDERRVRTLDRPLPCLVCPGQPLWCPTFVPGRPAARVAPPSQYGDDIAVRAAYAYQRSLWELRLGQFRQMIQELSESPTGLYEAPPDHVLRLDDSGPRDFVWTDTEVAENLRPRRIVISYQADD